MTAVFNLTEQQSSELDRLIRQLVRECVRKVVGIIEAPETQPVVIGVAITVLQSAYVEAIARGLGVGATPEKLDLAVETARREIAKELPRVQAALCDAFMRAAPAGPRQ